MLIVFNVPLNVQGHLNGWEQFALGQLTISAAQSWWGSQDNEDYAFQCNGSTFLEADWYLSQQLQPEIVPYLHRIWILPEKNP